MLQQIHPAANRTIQPWYTRKVNVAARSVGRRTAVLGGLCCCSGCACAHRNKWYDRYFAYNMAYGMEEYEAAIRPVKQQLFKQLLSQLPSSNTAGEGGSQSHSSGPASVLEVGMGTGPNLPFYTKALSGRPHTSVQQGSTSSSTSSSSRDSSSRPLYPFTVTGLEPNAAMWPYAQEAAAASGLQQGQLQLVAGDAQQMPFEDASFDAAVMTLVLCSVPRPQQVLSELLRVLKPGASLLLIEHVIAPQLSFLQLQQRLLDPLQQLLADNCHLTRDTAAILQASGFALQQLPPQPPLGSSLQGAAAVDVPDGGVGDDRLPGAAYGNGDLWRFEVPGMGLIAPHIAGLALKRLPV